LALLVGVVHRRGKLVLAGTVAALFALSFWGWLFIPRTSPAHARGDTLTVMSYNLLGPQEHTRAVLDVLRAEHPDVVLFQELNPQVAAALESELKTDYPYQILRAERGVRGMGAISRYPLRDTGEVLEASWVGTPQVLDLDWEGQPVRVLNFHMQIPPLSPHLAGRREVAAEALIENAAEAMPDAAVIVAGDANVTHLSDTYRTLTGLLEDSWGQAGYGFGHSWGGSIFTRWLGLPFPAWIVRIDYVFHSRDLHAVSAHTARFDGGSDHRGVVVTLARNPNADPS
jgi:endonuclease/exonuclease/phosphatase (EEP) superfamily protein YafD